MALDNFALTEINFGMNPETADDSGNGIPGHLDNAGLSDCIRTSHSNPAFLRTALGLTELLHRSHWCE